MHNYLSFKLIIVAIQAGSNSVLASVDPYQLSISLFKRGEVQELDQLHSERVHAIVNPAKMSCATNEQCQLNNHPKYRFKYVWSRSPDVHAISSAKKQRSDMFRPRKDFSKLNQAHLIKWKTYNKKLDSSDTLLVRKTKTILPQNQPSFKGTFNSCRDYLRNQHRQGTLSPSEALEYQRTIRVKQEEYNKKRREQRKHTKKKKAK